MTRDYARNYRPQQPKQRNTRVAPTKRGTPGWVWMLAGLLLGSALTGVLMFSNTPPPTSDDIAGEAAPEEAAEEAPTAPSHKPRFDFYTLLKETEVIVPDENGEMPAKTKTVVIPDAKSTDTPQTADKAAVDTLMEAVKAAEQPKPATNGQVADKPANPTVPAPQPATQAKDTVTASPVAQATPSTPAPAPTPTVSPAPTPAPTPTAAVSPPPPPASQPSSRFILQAGSFKNASDADSVRARLLLLNMHASVERVSANGGETWHRVMIGPFASPEEASRASTMLRQNGIDSIQLKRN